MQPINPFDRQTGIMTDQPGRVAKLTTLMNAMLISKLGTLSDRFLGGSQPNSQDTFDLSQWP
jgi:hypothetical protein